MKNIEKIKKILKKAHATSCTPKNCGCGMDQLEWQLSELVKATEKSEYERGREEILEKVETFANFQIKQKALRYPDLIEGINRTGLKLKELCIELRKEE